MKRPVAMVASVLATLAGLLAAGAWLLATDGGFRWLTETASAHSSGRLTVEGVEGHLGVPLGIRRLTLVTGTQRITIERLRLEWLPRALWQRRIEVDLLAAQAVRVEILETRPPELPASLRWPLDLTVAVIDVATLEQVEAGRTLRFQNLRARLDGRGAHYRLSGAALDTPWAALRGDISLAKDAPFTVHARIDATRSEPRPVAARLVVGGTLAGLDFRLEAAAEGMNLLVSGEAAPFDTVRVRRLLVAGAGLDPSQFVADAPRADLAFSGLFEGVPGERLLGSFSLSNQAAGRLDQQRLPLTSLTGAVLGDATHADFSALLIDLGPAGRLSGDGQWRDGRFAVTLAGTNIDLAGLHRDLYATRIETTLKLAGDAARQTLDAEVSENWGQGRFTLSHAQSLLRLESADFSGKAGRLVAQGSLQLDPGRAFSVRLDAARINPARFGAFPRARLNARGEASGALAPQLRVQAAFTLPPGELEGRPVSGQGRLRYADHHLADADIRVNLAGNQATVTGAWGRTGDRLGWDIDAPALARLNLGLAGRLVSRGSAGGDPAAPQIAATVAASGLHLPGGITADALNLKLDLQAAADGPFNGQLDARGVVLAGQRLNAVRATLQGRRTAHALAFDARLPDWHVTAALAGGLDAQHGWRGQLTAASAQGPWPLQLMAPAALLLTRERQQVNQLVLSVGGGRVAVEQFSREGERLASRGTLDNLPAAPLLAMLDSPPPFTTDLRFQGGWDMRLGEALDGQLRLRRQSGDVRMKTPALNLGLTTLALTLDAVANRVDARLAVAGREAGQLQADGQATLQREGAVLILSRTAPLAWHAQFDLPDLRLLQPLIPVGVRADARLTAQLTGNGTLAAPRVQGRFDASQIHFAMPEAGITLREGRVSLQLNDDRVRVLEGELKGPAAAPGGGGRILLGGEAQLRNPRAGLTLLFEQFALSHRSDRRVSVSGRTRLVLDPRQLELTGELTADRGRLEMPEASRPQLSPDVVVVGQPPREAAAAQRIPLRLDLKLDLGRDFLFKGRGLDARLGGQLRVFTVEQTLRGEGTIRVEQGRFAAYGQTLDIERGELRFIGPLDNPGLDVLALRKTARVKAGVQVRGTVQQPVVTLYSDPPMPDAEKLSWLVLGHGLEHGSPQQFALMQIAAGALLSQAEAVSTQAKVAEALHIDTFEVRGGEGEDLASTVVSVGKRLSSDVTVVYQQSLDGLNQMVRVLYQITPQVRLEAGAGLNSSVDVFYTRDYD